MTQVYTWDNNEKREASLKLASRSLPQVQIRLERVLYTNQHFPQGCIDRATFSTWINK